MTLLGSVQTTSLLVVLIAKEKQKKKERREQDMAIYHLETKVVSRGTGRSAVAASAYLSCSRLCNDYDGIQHDYTRKQGLVRADKHPQSTRYGRQNSIYERWNSEEQLATWADVSKRCLERAGREERIVHRSNAAQGLDEIPAIHEGVTAQALERKGIVSDCCEINRQIKADNALLWELKAEIKKLAAIVAAPFLPLRRGWKNCAAVC